MTVEIRLNNELESFRLVDLDSDQSHDGDGAVEVIADVYTEELANKIASYLNAQTT
jgi:hypothetical protein